MAARTVSRVTVTVSLEPGEWVTTSAAGQEASVIGVTVIFHDGRRSEFLDLDAVKRRSNGTWGNQGAGYVEATWDAAPQAVRDLVRDHYGRGLDQMDRGFW